MTPEVRQLVAGLREVRDSTGLSLARLAARTPYSKSSWARYLGGTAPVPHAAVEALCRVAGERPDRLLALWELADAEWSGRAALEGVAGARAAAPAVAPVAAPVASARRHVPWLALALAVGTGAACAAVLAGGGPAPGDAAATATPTTYAPGCTGKACDGEDPAVMGCGGQGMVVSAAERTLADGRRVELRYGRVCHAVWARASRLRIGDRVELIVPGARPKDVRASDAGAAHGYLATTMTATDGARAARVCLLPAGGGARVCFGA